MSVETTEIRRAARLVVVDGDGRVLLFLHVEDAGRRFWATPGGGAKRGETPRQAARREAAEELGVRELEIEELWTREVEIKVRTRKVLQTETFFLASTGAVLLGPEVAAAHTAEGIVEARWWSITEIEAAAGTGEPIFPPDLAAKLKEHLPARARAG
jgi:ADP-ribose pyrophosphatase YjhB (NUDIX family)